MEKRMILMPVFLMFIFSFGIAEAVPCNIPQQTIASLYSENNSHVAFFNLTNSDANAGIGICYDKIFETSYAGGADPWKCTGDNKLLNIYYYNNSHASSLPILYGIDLCYGDLSCVAQSSACSGNAKEVLALSQLSNAHVAVNNSVSEYIYRLCCSNTEVMSGITNAQWENPGNNLISQAMLGDGVKLSAYTTNMAGKTINFTIYNKSNNFILYNRSATVNPAGKAELSGALSSFVSGKAGPGAFIYFNATYYNSTTGAIISQERSNDLNITAPANVFNTCSFDKGAAIDSLGISHDTSIADSGNWCFGFLSGQKDDWPDALRNYTTSLNDCCPTGQICTNSSGSGSQYFKCAQCTKTYLGIDNKYHAVTRCNDYSYLNVENSQKKELCNADCANARSDENDRFINSDPNYVINSTFCYWDDANNKCNVNKNRTAANNSLISYSCQDETTSESGSCDNGNEFKTITYVSRKTKITFNSGPRFVIANDDLNDIPSNSQCPDGEVTVPCRKSVIALPFFSAGNIIITVLIIAAIYFIIFKTKLMKKIFK